MTVIETSLYPGEGRGVHFLDVDASCLLDLPVCGFHISVEKDHWASF